MAELESSSDTHRNRQPICNPYLTSALAVLFLAYRQHIWNGMPLECAREGLKRGHDLARSLCEVSSSSRRLLNSFSRLKELISRLVGDFPRPSGREDLLLVDQGRPDWRFWTVPPPQGLILDQESDFSLLFEKTRSLPRLILPSSMARATLHIDLLPMSMVASRSTHGISTTSSHSHPCNLLPDAESEFRSARTAIVRQLISVMYSASFVINANPQCKCCRLSKMGSN